MSFLGSGLQRPEQIAAAWFGPKGFAAVAVGLLVLESQIPAADAVYHLVAHRVIRPGAFLHRSAGRPLVRRTRRDPLLAETTTQALPDPAPGKH